MRKYRERLVLLEAMRRIADTAPAIRSAMTSRTVVP